MHGAPNASTLPNSLPNQLSRVNDSTVNVTAGEL
jgi:hypothetical protein